MGSQYQRPDDDDGTRIWHGLMLAASFAVFAILIGIAALALR